jgi:hypothetical protein
MGVKMNAVFLLAVKDIVGLGSCELISYRNINECQRLLSETEQELMNGKLNTNMKEVTVLFQKKRGKIIVISDEKRHCVNYTSVNRFSAA